MTRPAIQRHGDAFVLTWQDEGVGFGFDNLRDSSDGVKCELTVESIRPAGHGRVLGPDMFNLMATQTKKTMANTLADRVNGLSAGVWHQMVVQACSMVVEAWRQPTPVIDLSKVDTTGGLEYLIPGLVPLNETTVLYGDGESSKSMLAMLIGVCCQLGIPLPWGPTPRLANVLYLDWETTEKTIALRMKRICAGLNVAPPMIQYRECLRSIIDELPALREEISRREIDLVIVDSIGYAASGALVEDETARSVMRALRNMGRRVTRLGVAHISRADAAASGGKAKPFGSAFFWNGMRSGIEVRRAEDQADEDAFDVGLFHWKANDGQHQKPIALRVGFDGLTGPIVFDQSEISDVPELEARTSLSNRIRGILRKGAMNTKELALLADEEEPKVRVELNRMRGVQVVNPGGGRGRPATWGLSQ